MLSFDQFLNLFLFLPVSLCLSITVLHVYIYLRLIFVYFYLFIFLFTAFYLCFICPSFSLFDCLFYLCVLQTLFYFSLCPCLFLSMFPISLLLCDSVFIFMPICCSIFLSLYISFLQTVIKVFRLFFPLTTYGDMLTLMAKQTPLLQNVNTFKSGFTKLSFSVQNF